MDRPNILYIHSHDTGRYIQPYGYAVPTPNIQHLAEEGILFRQMFCGGPTCSASRASLLTGQCGHSSGMIGLAHRGFALADHGHHIVHTLKAAGYRAALFGVQHVANRDDRPKLGYDEIADVASHRAEDVAPAAARFLRDGPAQPFFLSVGFTETHREFRPAGALEDARYCRPPAPLPDTPETRRDMADFMASARVYDWAVGEVLNALSAAGLQENTLVICTTDHGIAFPAMKCNLTDHGIGVMFLMRGPGGATGGRVCDALVSHVDVFPTICDLLGIEQPAWIEGRSMMPLVRGEADEINEAIFSEVTYHAAYEPMRCVRTRRWKYIRRFEERTGPVLPNCDDSLSKTLWMENGWKDHAPAMEQLYDLVFDPNETNNLAGDRAFAGPLGEMRDRLDRHMAETDDPLLAGPVPAPSGAKFSNPDGLSPREEPMVAP